MARNVRVESVEVVFTATTADKHWGDLQILLLSPSGTWSVLAEKHDTSESTSRYDHWRFGSERYLGEPSEGSWTLVVKDLGTAGGATFGSWRLIAYGTEQDAPAPAAASALPDSPRAGNATTTFQASPAYAGTTEPGATATVPAGSSLPILAVPAYDYTESLAGLRALPCTFAGWTADPPENVTFADAGRQSTTATFHGDAAVTAHFRAPDQALSPGSGITVAAADLGLETFSHKPQVYGMRNGKLMAMTVYGGFPSPTFVAGWPAKPKIYDPADYKNLPQGLGALLDQEPMPAVPLDKLIVQADEVGAPFDLAAPRTFLLSPPEITQVDGDLVEGNTLTIQGLFFGTKPPKVFVEYVRGGIFLTKECKREGDLPFEDLSGKPSCMYPLSGQSSYSVTCPKTPAGAALTGYIILKSAMGMGAYFVPVRRPVCE